MGRMRAPWLPLVLCATLGSCAPASPDARQYLHLWTASADPGQPDFLAVLDVLIQRWSGLDDMPTHDFRKNGGSLSSKACSACSVTLAL